MASQEVKNAFLPSFRRTPWLDEPFDRLTVLSRVEGLTTLSIAEGESIDFRRFWMPDHVRHDEFGLFTRLSKLQLHFSETQ